MHPSEYYLSVPCPQPAADVTAALAEDLGSGDVSAALIPADSLVQAQVITREEAIICGIPWFNEVFRQVDAEVQLSWEVQDGDAVQSEQCLCTLHGAARSLLSGERSALNFLQTLSATATQVRKYVTQIADTGVILLDTRKTLPGLRQAQKYAVRCGGGQNHRMGLFDAFLLKENHLHAAGSLSRAVLAARALNPNLPLEVEVETLQQLQEALSVGVDAVLLDNFSLETMRAAVALTNGQAKLEASGGVEQEKLRAIAETGVDYISIGAFTKHVRAVDLSMRFVS